MYGIVIIASLLVMIAFNSCRKDYLECGNITAKGIKPDGQWINSGGTKGLYFLVNHGYRGIDTINVGIIQWDQYKVGDQYCN